MEALIHHASYLLTGLCSEALTLVVDRIPETLPETPLPVTVKSSADGYTLVVLRKGGDEA